MTMIEARQAHLRHAGKTAAEQTKALKAIVLANAGLVTTLRLARELELPDWLITSGAIYQSVWNHLTGRPALHGIKDFDLIYFDDTDLSYEAEDRVIARARDLFASHPVPVEVRNQARVHLWFESRFGQPYAPLNHAAESLERYATRTHAVAVRLGANDHLEIVAPFGLDLMFSFRLVPNRVLDNGRTHAEKAARVQALWPELCIEPW